MSTCRWCTPSGPDATEFLKSYASKRLSLEDLEGSNEDLCYCLECVLEYHKAKEKLPRLHEVIKSFGSNQRGRTQTARKRSNEVSVVQPQCRGKFCAGVVFIGVGE